MQLTNEQAWTAQIGLFKKALAIIGPKRRDYSGGKAPFSNFYKSEFFGVSAWKGALIRLSDKLSRLDQLAQKAGQGDVKDESFLDTAADALNYVAIVVGLVIETLSDEQADKLLAELEARAKEPWPTETVQKIHGASSFLLDPLHGYTPKQ